MCQQIFDVLNMLFTGDHDDDGEVNKHSEDKEEGHVDDPFAVGGVGLFGGGVGHRPAVGGDDTDGDA